MTIIKLTTVLTSCRAEQLLSPGYLSGFGTPHSCCPIQSVGRVAVATFHGYMYHLQDFFLTVMGWVWLSLASLFDFLHQKPCGIRRTRRELAKVLPILKLATALFPLAA